jgi:hypothetical protein
MNRLDRRKVLRKILSGVLLFLFAMLPIICGVRWGFNKHRYRQVSQWPSVPAEIQFLHSTRHSIPVETRTGSRWQSSTFDLARFTYQVGGIVYQGHQPSPDGQIPPMVTGSISGKPSSVPEYRAYYKPGQPEVAVLFPLPYQGDALLLIALVTGGIWALALVISYTRLFDEM